MIFFIYAKTKDTKTITKKSNYPDALGMSQFPYGIKSIVSRGDDGSIHVGENSAVFKEENGREKFWAQDANGKSIPIDITNGSKLLINGSSLIIWLQISSLPIVHAHIPSPSISLLKS